MQMPVMNGREATKRIKSMPGGESVSIIAITATAFDEDRESILLDGCSTARGYTEPVGSVPSYRNQPAPRSMGRTGFSSADRVTEQFVPLMSHPRALAKPGWKEGIPGGLAFALAASGTIPDELPSGIVSTVGAAM